MEIVVQARLVLTLHSKQEWVNKIPNLLPQPSRSGERLIWLDKHGNVFECGADFSAAAEIDSFPCKVYRPVNVVEGAKELQSNG